VGSLPVHVYLSLEYTTHLAQLNAVYFVDAESFYANLSCAEGHVFDDTPSVTSKIVECLDFFWDSRVPHCVSK